MEGPGMDEAFLQLVRRLDLAEPRESELWGWLQGLAAARHWDGGMQALAAWLEEQEAIHEEPQVERMRILLTAAREAAWGSDGRHRAAAEGMRRGLEACHPWLKERAGQHTLQPIAAYDEDAEVEFEARQMVFTGIMRSCSRESAESGSRALGARVDDRVAQCRDFLIVGSRPSPAWKHSQKGRKIDLVERWRRQGKTGCRIVREHQWVHAFHREARRRLAAEG